MVSIAKKAKKQKITLEPKASNLVSQLKLDATNEAIIAEIKQMIELYLAGRDFSMAATLISKASF